jgi:DNA-binding response OmpR family regulator
MTDELARKRILVVEEDFFAAAELQDLLDKEGCAVAGPVASTEGAVTCLLEAQPDAAILDVALDAEDTEPLLAELAAACVPILYVAASDGQVHAREGTTGIACSAPLDRAGLRIRLRTTLGGRGLREQP